MSASTSSAAFKQEIGEMLYLIAQTLFPEGPEERWGKVTAMLLDKYTPVELNAMSEKEKRTAIIDANDFYNTCYQKIGERIHALVLEKYPADKYSTKVTGTILATFSIDELYTSDDVRLRAYIVEARPIVVEFVDARDSCPSPPPPHDWDNDSEEFDASWMGKSSDDVSTVSVVEVSMSSSVVVSARPQHDDRDEVEAPAPEMDVEQLVELMEVCLDRNGFSTYWKLPDDTKCALLRLAARKKITERIQNFEHTKAVLDDFRWTFRFEFNLFGIDCERAWYNTGHPAFSRIKSSQRSACPSALHQGPPHPAASQNRRPLGGRRF